MAAGAADPLEGLERISDPVTYSLFEKDGKRIVLLGDIHVSNEKKCSDCKKPDCLDYISLMRNLDTYSKKSGTELDIFIEQAAPINPKDEAAKQQVYKEALNYRRTLRRKSQYLRLLNVRKEFGPKLYFHERTGLQQRYHYIDVRMSLLFQFFGFYMGVILNGTTDMKLAYYAMFQLAYPTKKKLLDTALAICFSKQLRLPEYLKGQAPFMSKIAKQVYKLPAKEQALVRKFFTRQFQSVLKTWDYQKEGDQFMNAVFWLMSGMMDVYAVSRLLYYHSQQKAGSTSLVLAGAYHTRTYSEFLKEAGAKVVVNTELSFAALVNNPAELAKLPHCVKIPKRRGGITRRKGRVD